MPEANVASPLKSPPKRPPIRSLLVAVLLLALGLVAVTLLNYRTALRVAEETLRNQGTAIGLELAAEARGRGARDSEALEALISERGRREIAFLAVIERDGTVLAHSNPGLAGTRLDDPAFVSVRDTGRLSGNMVTLATGEEVYELTVPFHIPPTGAGGIVDIRQPRFRILRLALHTAPARQIVYQAQAQVLFVGVLVLVLLGLSAWQIRTLRRYLALQEEAARQERLAALGGMAAVLAHEIRNPLGAIKGLAQFLGEKRSADSTHQEMTQTIAQEATRLERLVNDLLSYARPRPPDRQPTDPSAVLGEVLRMLLPAAEAAGVVCRLDIPEGVPHVTADPEQMKQLFGNLALNAIQAMPNGGKLTLALRSADGKDVRRRGVEVAVEDTGSGIPDADLPRIFEPFYTTRTKGTGLGLAICKQIVEAHGGTLRVARTGPEGTTILVTLPMEDSVHG